MLLAVGVVVGVACTRATLLAVHQENEVVQLAQEMAASHSQAPSSQHCADHRMPDCGYGIGVPRTIANDCFQGLLVCTECFALSGCPDCDADVRMADELQVEEATRKHAVAVQVAETVETVSSGAAQVPSFLYILECLICSACMQCTQRCCPLLMHHIQYQSGMCLAKTHEH